MGYFLLGCQFKPGLDLQPAADVYAAAGRICVFWNPEPQQKVAYSPGGNLKNSRKNLLRFQFIQGFPAGALPIRILAGHLLPGNQPAPEFLNMLVRFGQQANLQLEFLARVIGAERPVQVDFNPGSARFEGVESDYLSAELLFFSITIRNNLWA